MAKQNTGKHASLSGVVVPCQWDASDRLVEVALFNPEEGELTVLPLGMGRKLLGLTHCRVAVQGRVSSQDGRRVIEVQSYKVLADATGSGYEAESGQ
jgi:hypothetical protein